MDKMCTRLHSVDATKETNRLGRLVNHSKAGNCQTKLHPINGSPHLILVASRDIKADEELLYDYGDRSKASVLAHPWLKHWIHKSSLFDELIYYVFWFVFFFYEMPQRKSPSGPCKYPNTFYL